MTADSLRTEPVQRRAQERIDSILEAARQHYAEVGRDRFNTGDVAAKAGCAVGTVYRYFEDRVALLDAIQPNRDAAQQVLSQILAVDKEFLNPAQKWETAMSILKGVQ